MRIERRSFLKSGAAFLGSGMLLNCLAVPATAAENPTAPDGNIWEIFRKRRSVRKYRPDPIPEADIVRILDAARTPPSSGNEQPWKFLVIRDRDKILRMKEGCVQGALERFDSRGDKTTTREEYERSARNQLGNYFSAPVYIVVLTDNTYPAYHHWDGPMAAGYLMLAARALGYGTVFITGSIPDSVTKEVLRIPDNYTRVCITPLGVPVEWPESPPKKKLEEFIAYESL